MPTNAQTIRERDAFLVDAHNDDTLLVVEPYSISEGARGKPYGVVRDDGSIVWLRFQPPGVERTNHYQQHYDDMVKRIGGKVVRVHSSEEAIELCRGHQGDGSQEAKSPARTAGGGQKRRGSTGGK